MAKYAPKPRPMPRAMHLPGAGYLTKDERRLVLKETRRWGKMLEVGLATPDQARTAILERLEAYRAARRAFGP